MQEETKHTPLPLPLDWRTYNSGSVQIHGPALIHVAHIENSVPARKQWAEHIVTAVNSHEALLAACKELHDRLETIRLVIELDQDDDVALDRARAALALAK